MTCHINIRRPDEPETVPDRRTAAPVWSSDHLDDIRRGPDRDPPPASAGLSGHDTLFVCGEGADSVPAAAGQGSGRLRLPPGRRPQAPLADPNPRVPAHEHDPARRPVLRCAPRPGRTLNGMCSAAFSKFVTGDWSGGVIVIALNGTNV